MKRILVISGLALATLGLSGCSGNNTSTAPSATPSQNQNPTSSEVPTRGAEMSGTVSSIEGNEIVLKNEIGREVLSEEEMAKRRAERQKLSETERQALRDSETQGLKTEDVRLVVPVGVSIYKGTGQAMGDVTKVDLSEIKKGSYISVWKNSDQIEAIKIKGTN